MVGLRMPPFKNGSRLKANRRESSSLQSPKSSITNEDKMIEIHPVVYPIFALLTGILILIFPTILNYIVAIYLIIIGVLGIFGGKVL
jgi:hypothetical protein